jgi:hypothetical protein
MNLRRTGTSRALWPVDLRVILYRGDVAAQASALAKALANDHRARGAVGWRRAPSGTRWAEDGAIVLRCWLMAADAEDAERIGNVRWV